MASLQILVALVPLLCARECQGECNTDELCAIANCSAPDAPKLCPSECSSEVKCPPEFPDLDRKTGSNHGDVCRNDLIHGLNQGWNCVAGCCGQNSDPWCVMSGTTNTPCRVDSDQLIQGSASECPDGFPTLERHTGEANSGDICRNANKHGLNYGWSCVAGCCGRNSAPWCVQSGTSNSPCRAGNN